MNAAELETKITYLTSAIVRERINLCNAKAVLATASIAYEKAQTSHDDIRRILRTAEEQREAAEKDLAALMAAQEKK
jgi:hypothetical protein